MSTTSYATALAAAKKELAGANAELGEAQQRVQELGERISDLRQTVTMLSKLCGEENVEMEDALGLTDAIRKVFRDGHTEAFTVQDVRLQLEARGFQTRRYGNLLASIHVVVGRLVAKNELMQAGTKGGADKPSYKWAYKLDPPPRSRLAWEPVYESGMRGDEKPKTLSHPYRPGTVADVRKKE